MKYYQTKAVLLPEPLEDKKYPSGKSYLEEFEIKCNELGDQGWKLIQVNKPQGAHYFVTGIFQKEFPHRGGTQVLEG